MTIGRSSTLHQAIPHRAPPRRVALLIAAAGLALYALLLPYVASDIERVLARAGGVTNSLLYLAAPAGLLVWAYQIIRGRPLAALVTFIILLPLSGRAPRLVGIELVERETFTQVLSLTTALAVVTGIAVIALVPRVASGGVARRPLDAVTLWFAAYVFFVWLAQVWHHGMFTGTGLALGGAGQYLLVFLAARALARGPDGLPVIVAAVVGSFLLNVLFRVLATGSLLTLSGSTEQVLRAGGFAFGPAVSYGGYVAMAVVLALGLWRTGALAGRRWIWFLAASLLMAELVLTQTRGAIFALAAVGYLFRWRRERGWLFPGVVAGSAAVLAASALTPLFSTRQIYFDARLFREPNVVSRFELFWAHLKHWFDGGGLGHGIGNEVYEYAPSVGLLLPPHNVFLSLSQETGAFATAAFIGLLVAVAIRAVRSQASGSNAPLGAYALAAIGIWVLHGSLSGGSITFYYPYEASLILFTILGAVLGAADGGASQRPAGSASQGPDSAAGAAGHGRPGAVSPPPGASSLPHRS